MEMKIKSPDQRFTPEPRDNGWALYIMQKPHFGAKFRFLKPGSEMHLHSTQDWEEIIHILSGEADIYTRPQNGEGQWVKAVAGHSFFLHTNTLHRLRVTSPRGMAYLSIAIQGGFQWHDVK
jgi:oxalate decarboxylase/phosphoglucose isomerase-like protein (cupin superfamily)